MNVDVVCVGDPFLDLIFLGLEAFPAPGTEMLASRLRTVPGGMANVAFALRRLGLDAVICAPVGRDPAGRLLQELIADAGIPWLGRSSDATPVTVALPAEDDRALVSVMPSPTVDAETLATIAMRAVVVDLPSAPLLPPVPRVYAVVGDPEVAALVGRLPESLQTIHALLLNRREATGLTGETDPRVAAARLAGLGTTVVVTMGPEGAIAIEPDGRTLEVAAPQALVADPTGAGDLFVSAYVWADLDGRPLDERLRLATRYASRSLERASDGQKGLGLAEFVEDLVPG